MTTTQKMRAKKYSVAFRGVHLSVLGRLIRGELLFHRKRIENTTADSKRQESQETVRVMQDLLLALATSKPIRKEA